MVEPSENNDETKQLQALHTLKILDSHPEARFDRVMRLAKRLFDVPIAILNLAEPGRHAVGNCATLGAFEAVREREHDPGSSHRVFVVADTRADPRFKDSPLAIDGFDVRFYAGCPVCAPDGRRMGTLCLLDRTPRSLGEDDIDLLNELGTLINERFQSLSLATSDDLTKLANRRGFQSIASHILPMARRLDLPLALVQFDLDEFKAVNDNHGHEAGDRVLTSFARHLLKHFHESDVVARLGGDEFCVLISGASESEVRQSLEHLRARLTEDGADISFSAGVAAFDPGRHAAIDDLLRDADRTMYANKRRKHARAAPVMGA